MIEAPPGYRAVTERCGRCKFFDDDGVICRRCGSRFYVVRNFGGGIRREKGGITSTNPAICDCGSRQLEVY